MAAKAPSPGPSRIQTTLVSDDETPWRNEAFLDRFYNEYGYSTATIAEVCLDGRVSKETVRN